MNNDIQETYCSFEVSKLLKEKGLDMPSFKLYTIKTKELGTSLNTKPSFWNRSNDSYAVITHALAIEWIKQNFSSSKIEHLSFDMSAEVIDYELKNILKNL